MVLLSLWCLWVWRRLIQHGHCYHNMRIIIWSSFCSRYNRSDSIFHWIFRSIWSSIHKWNLLSFESVTWYWNWVYYYHTFHGCWWRSLLIKYCSCSSIRIDQTRQDIENQQSLLNRFDTFLCIHLFGPSKSIQKLCLNEDCIDEYLLVCIISVDGNDFQWIERKW